MYSIICDLDVIPVFVPQYSLYFFSRIDFARPSIIINPYKPGNTNTFTTQQSNNGAVASISLNNSSFSRIQYKRGESEDPSISLQSKRTKAQITDKQESDSSPISSVQPSNIVSSFSTTSSVVFFAYPRISDPLLQTTGEKSKEVQSKDVICNTSKDDSEHNQLFLADIHSTKENNGNRVVDDYTEFASHKPIQTSTIKDYSVFLPLQHSPSNVKQDLQRNAVKEGTSEIATYLHLSSKDEREEGEISSYDSVSSDTNIEDNSMPFVSNRESNDKDAHQNSSEGDRKAVEVKFSSRHSKNVFSTPSIEDEKWSNDMFESSLDLSQSNPNTSQSRYSNHQEMKDKQRKYHQGDADGVSDSNSSLSYHRYYDGYYNGYDYDYNYEYGYNDDDHDSDYRQKHRHRHRHRHRYDYSLDFEQSHQRHDSKSSHYRSGHSKEMMDEESTSQSDFEEYPPNFEKLRKVSHLWRKKERNLSGLPLEEGEVPIENVKKSFFKKEGINLMSS